MSGVSAWRGRAERLCDAGQARSCSLNPNRRRGAALGHNSRGVDIEAEERQEAATAAPRRDIDVGALVARAAKIQSAHVASRRKGLTIATFKPERLTQTPDSK